MAEHTITLTPAEKQWRDACQDARSERDALWATVKELEAALDDACAHFVANNRTGLGRVLAFMADTNPHFKRAVDAYLRDKEEQNG